jgi:hypothetical protein
VGFPIGRARRDAGNVASPTHHEAAIEVAVAPTLLYGLITDITRTGEWSPICVGCAWDEPGGARVGAWFTGENETDRRRWQTRSQVVVADPGREFAWLVGQGYVRWGYRLEPVGDQCTRLTESWHFLPAGLAMFQAKYGGEATTRIAERARQAVEGIPATLVAIKRIVEHVPPQSLPG